MGNSYKDLLIWQKGIELCLFIYKVTDRFPSEEKFGLVSQMRRSAVSVPSNIAEGRCRSTRNEFRQFLHIAFGSAAELGTQVIIARNLGYLSKRDFEKLESDLDHLMKMLNAFIQSKTS